MWVESKIILIPSESFLGRLSVTGSSSSTQSLLAKQCQNRGHQQQDQTSDKAKLWVLEHRFNAEYDIPDMFRSEDTTSEQAWSGGYRSMIKEITVTSYPHLCLKSPILPYFSWSFTKRIPEASYILLPKNTTQQQ